MQARSARTRAAIATPDLPAVTVGQLVREERNRQQLSQFALAQRLGCREAVISQLETGTRSNWAVLKQAIDELAPRAGRLWISQSTKALMGSLDLWVWEQAGDPLKSLRRAAWLHSKMLATARPRSSGDRATATSTGTAQGYLPGFGAELKEPQFDHQRVA